MEGVYPTEEEQVRYEEDYKIFVDSDFAEGIVRRMLRDQRKGKRTFLESLQHFLSIAVRSGDYAKKHESMRPDSDMDLVVKNDYQEPGNPRLAIVDNALTLFVNGVQVEKVTLDKEGLEARALRDILPL